MRLFSKVANFLDDTLAPVRRGAVVIGASVLIAIVLLVIVDVTLRRVFNSPLAFSFELIKIMLAVVVFCSIVYFTSLQREIRINILVSRFPPKAQTIINVVTCFFCVGLWSVIGWRSYVQAMHVWDTGSQTGILKIPHYPFLFLVATCSIFASLLFLIDLLNLVIGEAKK